MTEIVATWTEGKHIENVDTSKLPDNSFRTNEDTKDDSLTMIDCMKDVDHWFLEMIYMGLRNK